MDYPTGGTILNASSQISASTDADSKEEAAKYTDKNPHNAVKVVSF